MLVVGLVAFRRMEWGGDSFRSSFLYGWGWIIASFILAL